MTSNINQELSSTWNKFWKEESLLKMNHKVDNIPKDPAFYLVNRLLPTKNYSVLEAGSGDGRWVFWLAKHNYNAIGVDISINGLKKANYYAHKNKITNATFILADIRYLPFRCDFLDLLLSFGVIEHFTNPHTALSEFYRTIKKDSFVFITTPNIFALHSIKRSIKKALNRWNLGYELSYPPWTLSNFLKKAGFGEISSGAFNFGENKNELFEYVINRLKRTLTKQPFGFQSYAFGTKKY